MIIVDTNVFSEAIRPRPSDCVAAWWKSQDSLYTTAITVAEAFEGIEILPLGTRRMHLEYLTEQLFENQFSGKVLPFDEDAAREYADIFATRQRAGRPTTQTDAMIAGIARSRGMAVATRNLKDFEGCGVTLINPWDLAAC